MEDQTTIDREADLHYPYQIGQDAAKGDYYAVYSEYSSKFSGDTEADVRFYVGW